MDRITRKSLKDDRFASEVTHSVEYIAEHRRQAMIYSGVGIVVLALVLGTFFYRQHRKTAAHRALYQALQTYHALVTDEDRPGRITFRTAAEKNDKALKQFEVIARDYRGAVEGRIARYYIGLVYQDMGKTAEAQKQFEKVIAEGQDNILALARLALADVYLSQGKDGEARKIYEYLIKNPTDTVSTGRAQLAMARYLQRTKPDEARKLLLELIKRPGGVSGAAATMLREMGQQ